MKVHTLALLWTLLAVLLGTSRSPADSGDGQLAGPDLERADPRLRRALARWAEPGGRPVEGDLARSAPGLPIVLGADGRERVPCWIHHPSGAPPDWVETGLRLRDRSAARLTPEEIARLTHERGVTRIEAARRASPWIDLSVTEIGAEAVQNRIGNPPVYAGYSGLEVVVGIVDTGVDWNHLDFRQADGSTRLDRIWDQTADTVNPPADFGYGREWSAAEINAGLCTEDDPAGHGTHVLGIAGGNGQATGGGQPAYHFIGVAPRATLVVVKSTLFSTDIADGVDYIFRRAGALGMPAVVNLSLGHQWGPHDGSESLDQAIDALSGPGRFVVAAAGNQQQAGIHAEVTVSPGGSAAITFRLPVYAPHDGAENDAVYLDAYHDETAPFEVTITTPGGTIVGPVAAGESVDQETPDGAVAVVAQDVSGPAYNLAIQVYDKTAGSPPADGVWTLAFDRPTPSPQAQSATLDCWIPEHSTAGVPVFESGLTAAKLVGSPATADSALAIGAYVTRRCWTDTNGGQPCYAGPVTEGDLAYFSSHGPRRDGVLKPDLSAPGMGIASALSASWIIDEAYVLPDDAHVISAGTSMAAPHAAGVAALAFEALGPISAAALLARFESTARLDGWTGGAAGPAWGAGKIDAVGVVDVPSPVLLREIRARLEGEIVVLEWSVPEAGGRLRFAVLRGESRAAAVLVAETPSGPSYRVIDRPPPPAHEAVYWLVPLEGDLAGEALGPFRPEDSGERDAAGPGRLFVSRPRPNPTGGSAVWEVAVPRAGLVRVAILDVLGRRVRAWELRAEAAERLWFSWDGTDAAGRVAPDGVYWISAGSGRETAGRSLLRLASAGR